MKNTATYVAVALVACILAFLAYGRLAPPPAGHVAEPPVGATLLDGLGNHDFQVTTSNPDVQRWFNQGLMLTFGFNHDGAERSFLRATELDPECAMCWWGAALVIGPHVNAGMDPANHGRAWSRLQRAQAVAGKTSERERAFIEALGARYAEDPPESRRALDEAYAEAMGRLAARFPDDLDAASFHAEALMDLQPWDYYDAELNPKGNTALVVSMLESVLTRNPDHPLALHLYVHAVESSADPQRGVAAADRLRNLIPGSGHLVHMPGHIYARVGRWHDAVLANQAAIAADDTYLELCGGNAGGLYPLGYVPHNHHFLWFAASMEGAGKVARAAARTTAERTALPQLMRTPGYEGMQHYWLTPWFDNVRFGRWEEIAATANPAPDLPYVTAIWHYAQAMAALRQGRREDAGQHHEALAQLAADPVMLKMLVWERYPLSLAVNIAERTVAAELALADGDTESAVKALREGTAIEDSIPYDEPPGWHAPVRQTLGAVLLTDGRAAEAEAVYHEELRRNPHNIWSLTGLALSLHAQKKGAEAQEVEQQLTSIGQHADVTLVSSRL